MVEEKEVKKWYESKLVWLAFFQTILGVSDFIDSLIQQGPIEWTSAALIVSGVVAVILRVWFTDTGIE